MDLGLSGLVSGLDWRTLVDQLAEVERVPARRLRAEQTTLQQQNTAYTTLKTQLSALQSRIILLQDPALFDSRQAGTSDGTLATAVAGDGATLGTFSFNFLQLATAARQLGASGAGSSLSATNDVSGLVLSEAAFATSVTAGTFTVNGRQVTIATTDTLQEVFDKISLATGGTVNGGYDAASDRITLNSTGPIVLGSATDSSNFLQVARLHNNGTGTVVSAAELGVVRLTASLGAANFTTPVSDGGAGAGEFKINGVTITFAETDTMAAVLKRINDSAAGVAASYDAVSDRFILTNKTTGDMGIALEDVTGNFLAATGLTGGTLERGQNLRYTVNGGSEIISSSNTITESTSGLAGLAVTALAAGAATVTVSSDTEKIKQAITDFIAEYNKVQSVIESQTASTTDAKGVVTAGVLANDREAQGIASQLRRLVTEQVSGLESVLKRLDDLGIVSNGNDNTLKLEHETKLDTALAERLGDVRSLFADATGGLAGRLNAYMEKLVGEDGALPGKQDKLTRAAAAIDVQIADFERIVQANRERMIQSFIAMETAQSRINQQLQFLQQRFASLSTSSK